MRNLLFNESGENPGPKSGFTKNVLTATRISNNKISWQVPIPKRNIALNQDTDRQLTLVNTIDDITKQSVDLNGDSSPFKGYPSYLASSILPSEWQEAFYTGGRTALASIGYNLSSETVGSKYYIKNINYDSAKTIGYYQLMGAMSNINDPINTYILVSDADAPT